MTTFLVIAVVVLAVAFTHLSSVVHEQGEHLEGIEWELGKLDPEDDESEQEEVPHDPNYLYDPRWGRG